MHGDVPQGNLGKDEKSSYIWNCGEHVLKMFALVSAV